MRLRDDLRRAGGEPAGVGKGAGTGLMVGIPLSITGEPASGASCGAEYPSAGADNTAGTWGGGTGGGAEGVGSHNRVGY